MDGLWVSGEFFNTLEVRPMLGRVLTAADDRRGCAAPPAVISYGFWQREYGGSAAALGRTLTLDGNPFEIVGITAPGFFGVEIGRHFDVAVPLCAEPLSRGPRSYLDRNDGWFLAAIGRLKPGWTVEKAAAHLRAISPPMFKETLAKYRPEDEKAYLDFRLGAIPAGTGVSNLREYERPLWLLLATTVMVLLIACANLANLMLARATAREREIAVRLALGASRVRIVRQLLAESVLIAVAGAGAGAVLAQWLSRVLVASLATQNDRVFLEVAGDWRVFSFIAMLAAATCLLFGLLPAIRATATAPGDAMKAGSRGTTDTRERFGLRRVLVVAQVALSLVLVVGALLFVRTLRNLVTLDAGFAQSDLLIAVLNFQRAGIPDVRMPAAHADLLDRLRHQPGMEDAAKVRNVPVGGSFSNRDLIVGGVARQESVNFNWISDRYFRTMSAPLLAGRDINERDTATSPRVAIVTESFARVFFGGQNPLGKTFQIDEPPGTPQPVYEIVGFARDSKYKRSARSVRAAGVRAGHSERAARFHASSGRAIAAAAHASDVDDHGARPRSPPIDRRRVPNDAIAAAGLADARTSDGDAVGVLRRAGGVDCDDRPLRRHVVHGGAPPQRNRHSDGARRRPARGRRDGDARGWPSVGGRRAGRPGGLHRGRARGQHAPVRLEPRRSADVADGGSGARCRCHGGELPAGAARVAPRADRSAPRGVGAEG